VIDGSAGPWLTVGEVDGGALSNNIALADRASVGKVSSADRRKVLFCVSLECIECVFPWCTAQLCLSLPTGTQKPSTAAYPEQQPPQRTYVTSWQHNRPPTYSHYPNGSRPPPTTLPPTQNNLPCHVMRCHGTTHARHTPTRPMAHCTAPNTCPADPPSQHPHATLTAPCKQPPMPAARPPAGPPNNTQPAPPPTHAGPMPALLYILYLITYIDNI
jgi:hypothetical protein